MKRSRSSAFTLIELLVVITVIAILAALTLSVAGYAQKKAARSRAQSEIEALGAALENYKAEYGAYPDSSNFTASQSSQVLFKALYGANAQYNPEGKQFFQIPSKSMLSSQSYTTTSNYLVDPFGTSYEYRYPGLTSHNGTNSYDLWSYGGSSGSKTNDVSANWVYWVKNW